mmetsp:Transcript_137197/g.273803  ORF Transcript_137197/g.273803 Transcript_137197/m.273803 type:complete len:262 (-) Transcript_137197:593-1378(-)
MRARPATCSRNRVAKCWASAVDLTQDPTASMLFRDSSTNLANLATILPHWVTCWSSKPKTRRMAPRMKGRCRRVTVPDSAICFVKVLPSKATVVRTAWTRATPRRPKLPLSSVGSNAMARSCREGLCTVGESGASCNCIEATFSNDAPVTLVPLESDMVWQIVVKAVPRLRILQLEIVNIPPLRHAICCKGVKSCVEAPKAIPWMHVPACLPLPRNLSWRKSKAAPESAGRPSDSKMTWQGMEASQIFDDISSTADARAAR